MLKVLMVCLGNICRSPMAEGILRQRCQEQGLDWEIDSAGTSHFHIGEPPDMRAILTLRGKGIDISGLRARQFVKADFDNFDLILAMDASNYNNINRLAESEAQKAKVHLILNYSRPGSNMQVPDPYYGELGGFEGVYTMLNAACKVLISNEL